MLPCAVFRRVTLQRILYNSGIRSFSSLPPHEVVGLPALSPTMEKGNLAKWRLKEGSAISAGDILCEIETDKAIVDYEAQDDMYLAKILVEEGTEGINVGQPIMITVEDEESIEAFKNYKPEVSVSQPDKKSPEEIPPRKEEVAVDLATGSPVAPADFLVRSQTTQKIVSGPKIPEPLVRNSALPTTKSSPAKKLEPSENYLQAFEKWGTGAKKSAISSCLLARQKAYVTMYGFTGTFPLEKSK